MVLTEGLPPCYERSLSFFLHPLIRYSVSKAASQSHHPSSSSIKPKNVPATTPAFPFSALGQGSGVTFPQASSKHQLLNNYTLMPVLQTYSLASNICLWVCSSLCPPFFMFLHSRVTREAFLSSLIICFEKVTQAFKLLRCLSWDLSANSYLASNL